MSASAEALEVLEGSRRWAVVEGDALEVLRHLPAASIDILVTDPPYSSGGQFRGDRSQSTSTKYVQTQQELRRPDFTGDNRDQRGYLYWSALWLGECLRLARPGAIAAVFSDWRQLPTTTDALQAGGWVWRGIVPWNKVVARPAKGRFSPQCEYIVWGTAGPREIDPKSDAPCLPGFFQQYLKPSERHHIAGKPVAVLREILKLSPADGVVLDPFVGSGSTVLAAKLEGRRALGIEYDRGHAVAASERLRGDAPLFAAIEAEEVVPPPPA